MRRSVLALAAAAAFAPVARAGGPTGPAAGESCSYGTKIHFVATPKEAAAEALKQEKLVFILHISGHFEDPGLT